MLLRLLGPGLTRQSRLSQWVTAPRPPACGGGKPWGDVGGPVGGGRGGPHRGCAWADGNVQPGGAALRQTDRLTHRVHTSPRKRLRSALEFIMHVQIYVKMKKDILMCSGCNFKMASRAPRIGPITMIAIAGP